MPLYPSSTNHAARHYPSWTPTLVTRYFFSARLPYDVRHEAGKRANLLLDNPTLSPECQARILRHLLTGSVICLTPAMTALARLATLLPETAPALAMALASGNFTSTHALHTGLRAWTPLFGPDDWALALRAQSHIRDIILQCPALPSLYDPFLYSLSPHYRTIALEENPLALVRLDHSILDSLAPGHLIRLRPFSPPSMVTQIDTRLTSTMAGIRALAKHGVTPTIPVSRTLIARALASPSTKNTRARSSIVAAVASLPLR